MQENEFEKQVHEKMAGLKFQPTDAVWQRVESTLRKRKKRRYLFIWLPVYLGALLLAGYFFWQPGVQGKADQQLPPLVENTSRLNNHPSFKVQQDKSPTGDKHVPSSNDVEAGVIPNADADAGVTRVKKLPGSKSIVNGGSSFINPTGKGRLRNKRSLLVAANINGTKVIPGQQQLPPNAPELANTSAETGTIEKALPQASQTSPVRETPKPVLRDIIYAEVNPEPFSHHPVNTSLAMETIPKKSQISLTRLNRKTPWQVGFTFQAGRSAINSGKLNSLFRTSDASAMFSLPASNATPNANIYIPPSDLKQGPAFSPGIYFKKQVSHRLALTFGLNYALYTSSYQVGQKADSIITPQAYFGGQQQFAGLFRTGNQVKYTNRYHFVELPVMLRTKLTGRRETGLSWDLGFSISRLISTNALFYDPGARLFYKDMGAFNKMQWNVVTGLPVTVFSSKKVSALVGPQFQYGFTKLSSENNQTTHLVFIGLKAGFLLK